jgi:hypothetical protein
MTQSTAPATTRYSDTGTLIQINDAVNLHRSFRDINATVIYIPGVSPPNRYFGVGPSGCVGLKSEDGKYYGIFISDDGELKKSVSFVARQNLPPLQIPDDLGDTMIDTEFAEPGEIARSETGGAIRTVCRAPVESDFAAMSKDAGTPRRNLVFASSVFGVLSVVIYLVSKSAIAAILIGDALFSSSAYSNWQFFRDMARRRNLTGDARAVEEIHVRASRIIDVVPQGSNGPALVFLVEPDEALLLVGQWLAEYPSFPTAHFVVHRWRDTKERIRIDIHGDLVVPEASPTSLLPTYRFADIERFKATFDTLQQDMGIAFDVGRDRPASM